MNLEQHILDIRAGLKARRFSNEASVSQGIVLRLLSALSWNTYDTQVICPEYSLQGRRVDFALCHPLNKPIAFVEVKQVGQSEGAERQLFEYAFHVGVPLAILTDGQEWNFFLPAEQGDYGERRVYKLDIVERDIQECTMRFQRYLNYESIVSGKAIEAAREDYRHASRGRTIQTTLPKALAKLVQDRDELLIDLIADQVENLCGYKPDSETVALYLNQTICGDKLNLPSPPLSRVVSSSTNRNSVEQGIGFTLHGKFHPAKSGRHILREVFEILTKNDPSFPQKFAALPKHGRIRRYVAKNPEELYPDRPDLVKEATEQLSSGWWIGTNLSHSAIQKIIEMACEVAGLKFAQDLVLHLKE
jgi:hypothetical protein